MKTVFVVDREKWKKFISHGRVTKGPLSEVIANQNGYATCCDDVCKLLTPITLQDGEVLAVVDTEGVPLGEMLEIKPDFIEGISFSVSHHRRVIQEVKL